VRCSVLTLGLLLIGALPSQAQQPAPCRVLCAPEFKVEPTVTFTSLFNSPRIIRDDGGKTRDQRETDFELILSVGVPTRIRGGLHGRSDFPAVRDCQHAGARVRNELCLAVAATHPRLAQLAL
jgi:hypothetical protein